MKRRDFIKTGAVAAGVASSLKFLPSLDAAENDFPKSAAGENRSAESLRRARSQPLLPKSPEIIGATISPMPLAERMRRKNCPRRGFCSLTPDDGALLCGNGGMSIQLNCDPFDEQIPFRPELLYAPHRRPVEAPNIVDILPQVRQLLLEGKNHEAAALAYQKWHEYPVERAGFGGGGFTVCPAVKSASVLLSHAIAEGYGLSASSTGGSLYFVSASHRPVRHHNDGVLTECCQLEFATKQQLDPACQLVGQQQLDDFQRN